MWVSAHTVSCRHSQRGRTAHTVPEKPPPDGGHTAHKVPAQLPQTGSHRTQSSHGHPGPAAWLGSYGWDPSSPRSRPPAPHARPRLRRPRRGVQRPRPGAASPGLTSLLLAEEEAALGVGERCRVTRAMAAARCKGAPKVSS